MWRAGQMDQLRFTTEHINLGDGVLQVRAQLSSGPCVVDGVPYPDCTSATQEVFHSFDNTGSVVYSQPAGKAVFHPAHNHWHQSAVVDFLHVPGAIGAQVDALVGSGAAYARAVASRQKETFCLIDFSKTDLIHANSTNIYHHCGEDPQIGPVQGISVGWADSYHQSTALQQIDVTRVPDGVYTLIFVADPSNHWLEKNESNNNSWAEIRIYTQGGNRKVRELAHNPCVVGMTCDLGGNK
ncbi:MAG: hypothetical protein EXR72_04640 [Myxococcales bacterium]|nr:hypothetical protein [Myxococcales bacterium]